MSREERQALPYMVFSIQFICVAYFNRFDKFRRIAAANEKMLRWLWEKREELLLFQE